MDYSDLGSMARGFILENCPRPASRFHTSDLW